MQRENGSRDGGGKEVADEAEREREVEVRVGRVKVEVGRENVEVEMGREKGKEEGETKR